MKRLLLGIILVGAISANANTTDIQNARCISKVEVQKCNIQVSFGAKATKKGKVTFENYDGSLNVINLEGSANNYKNRDEDNDSSNLSDGAKTALFGAFYLGTFSIGPAVTSALSDAKLCKAANNNLGSKIEELKKTLPNCD